ncbi:diacylglycerol kinase family protein [Leucobacter sp. gxy201]|uniref:diacylglycerol/lipid kinase family protein n=1 Tax=Leucobacter sp. gxy201 TaxID=2957200 RepID=UPI003DA04D31
MTAVALLVNPVSGRGLGARAADAAVARLREHGIEPRVLRGGSRDEMRRLAAAAVRDRPDAIAVVGGDGTLSLILDDVLGCGIPIALVPAGTGNDLARALGLPVGSGSAASAEQAAAAIDLVLNGRTRPIDVGEIECTVPGGGVRRMRFLTVCAIGLDARVADRTNRLRWPKGRLRYFLALAIELLRLSALPFELRLDGGAPEPRPGILLAVGNTRSYGGGIPMCPDADPADGFLDITHVAPIGLARLLRIFPLLLQARHAERPEATMLRANEVEAQAPGLVAYADGERVGEGRVRIRLAAERLEVLAPA